MTGRLFIIGHKSNRLTKEAAEELEEMGEDTSDMIMSQSKMREMIMNATKVASNNFKGVDIQTELGNYKSTFQILSEIGAIWDEIKQADLRTGDNRQNLLLEAMAGKNRANTLASVLMHNDILQSAYQDSKYNAAGKATEELEKVSQSITFHLNQLTNAWQELWANAANRDVINMFIDLGTTILNLINDVGGLQSAFTLLWGGSILKGLMTADSWVVKFVRGLDAAKASSQGLGNTLSNIFTNLTGSTGDTTKETRWKGLAQIQKDREQQVPQQIQQQPPVITPQTNPAVVVSKQAEAEATQNATIANLENASSFEVLQIAQQGSVTTTTENTVAKTEGAAASQKVVQGNAQEAESAELATKALQEKTMAEIEAAEAAAVNEAATMSPKSLAKFSAQYDKELSKAFSEAGQDTMDWSMAYMDNTTAKINSNFDAIEKGAAGVGAILASWAVNPMTWLVAIPAIIGAITTGMSMWKKHQQDLVDSAKEATSTWNDTQTNLDNYAQKYQDLHTQLENVNLTEEEQIDIKKQIYDLQKQITDEYGHAADGINLVNGSLDDQLAKLRQIRQEQAHDNLRDNRKAYDSAIKEMEKTRTYEMIAGTRNATEEFNNIINGLGENFSVFSEDMGEGLTNYEIKFTGDASQAEKELQSLYDKLDAMGEEGREANSLQTLFYSVEQAIKENDKVLTKHKDNYESYLEQAIYADKKQYGDNNQFAGDILIGMEEAVNNYNAALREGDTSKIEEAEKAFKDVQKAAEDFYNTAGNERLAQPFKELEDSVDKIALETYSVKKKFDDSKTKNIVESILGSPKENKKAAEDIPDSLREAAENILDEQRKAYDWGMKPLGVNPLQGLYDTSQFGNINMDKRPIIKWNEEYRKRFAEALESWNYAPEDGMIDTVFGGSDNFNGLEIAFTPILATEDGKLKDFMSYDAVHNYIQGLVDKATDKDGNIDAQLVLDLDAGKVKDKDIIPKQIIGAIDGIGKYSAATVGKMMHFSGSKGSIALGMKQLSEAANKAGVDVNKVIEILRNTGNVDALAGVFDDFKYDLADIEGQLSDLPNASDDILTLADAFGITADSSQESINAVAELLGRLGYIATNSMDEAGESFDKFALKASGWIEETSNLSSTLSKGQGFLTFTKTQDDQGHEIASEVKAIADAYKDLEGYNYASLFEETATGIMVNAEALRALQAEEESMRHAEFYEKRQELMEKFTASSGMAAEAYRKQIEELDMLWSAYSGATSALSKYQNGHGAADYSTNYKLFRDQIFKEGDAYLESGEVGEEGFRRVAQLFSYKDLALASVDEVVEAYQKGADTMQKFFTENPTEGANLWIDEIMSWPEEYAKISTNAAGETVMTMTDKNLDAVAKHYGVSKDLILSLMNELNATGSRVHFFTDGQMQELDAVTEKAEAAKKRLLEIRDQGTDPALANSDILNFDIANMSADELKAKIEEIQALQADPDIDTETASLLNDFLQAAIDRLDILNGKHVEPDIEMNTDGLIQAEEVASGLNERLEQINRYRKLGYEVSISGDEKVLEYATEFAAMPSEMQIAFGFEPSTNPEELAKQIEEKFSEGVKIKVAPEIDSSSAEEFNEPGTIGKANVDVSVNPESIETAKQDVETGISSAQPEIEGKVKMPEPDDYVWQGASVGEIHIPADIDDSEARSTLDNIKEDAEQPMQGHLEIVPDNTVQDAANQAGASQGVVTEERKNTQVTETHNTVYTADTSGLDSANNAVNAMNGQTVNVTINVTGQDKVESANKQITSLVNKAKTKVNVTINGNATAFNKAYTDVNNKLSQLGSKETVPKIKADNSNLKDKVRDSKDALNSINDKKVTISATAVGLSTITSWKSSVYDQLHDKKITLTTEKKTINTTVNNPKINGTAHSSGTVMSSGHAYASGNWGLPRAEKGSLVNEIGPELVVNSRTGQWQILNDGYPTFADFNQGDIIFNAAQTESLLNNGYIRGSYARLKGNAFANGTVPDDEDLIGKAHITGTSKWNGELSGFAHAADGKIKRATNYSRNSSTKTDTSSSKKKSSNDDKGGGNKHKDHSSNDTKKSNQAAKDFLQTLDAIEIQLQRVDAELSRLDTNASKTYRSFSSRGTSLVDEIKLINKEIKQLDKSLSKTNKQFQGSNDGVTMPASYFAKAEQASKAAGYKSTEEGHSYDKKNVQGQALTDYWKTRIRNGVNAKVKKGDDGAMLTINDVGDEGLWKKIQAYQTWYEKGVKLQQKRQEYLNKLSALTIQRLQLTQKSYESALNIISEELNYNQQMIEAQQRFVKNDTIHYLNSNIKKDISKRKKLQKEADALQSKLDQAVKDGYITKGSEEYNTWTANIKKIKNDIIATENDMVNQTVAKLDYVQERWQSVLDTIDTEVEGYNTQIESRAYKQRIPKKLTPTKTKNDATLNDYNNIMIKDQQSINRLKKERKDIQKYLNEALRKSTDEGGIQKNSAIWREQQKRLKEIDNEIGSKTNDIVEQIINQLEHITDKWDTILDHIESHIDNIQARQDIRTEKGYAASEDYYRQEIAQQRQRRDVQVRQRNDLRAFLKKNLNVQTRLNDNGDLVPIIKNGKQVAKPGGKIAYGSKDYYEWMTKIQEATGDLLEIDKTLVKLNNDIRQLRWDAFDRAQEKIKNAAEEADFFNDLIYENKLFTENGQMTAQGRMSQGLITQQYDLYMKDAQQYGRMVKALNKQINKDPNNLDLIEQRDKWLEAQRQSIENAHKQKEAIRDLIEKGIKKQIEAMSKLIKKYEESLDAQRAQDQYAKSIADKQKRINSLQKQLKAMGGDDSEEGATKRQQLRDELKNAQQDLEDTQEDKRIADIKEALSNMQERYEEVLNARLENIEGLFTEAIQTTDANGANIVDSIERLAKSVGYDLSNEFAKASTDFVKALQGVKNVSDENQAGALVSNTDSRGKFDNSAATTVKNTTDSLPKEGTYTENGKKAFYFKGVKVKTGWNTIEGKKYYFNKDNTKLTGRQTIGNKDYYFGTDGALQVGTFKIGSTTYTTNKNGVITKKEKHTSDPTPAKKTTTTKKKATTTTKKKTATTTKKPATIKKSTTTKKKVATTTKKKTPGANYTGLWKDGSSTYYYVKGKKQTGWKDMKEGRRYFSTSGGKMLTGAQLIGGKTYLLDASTGVLKNGYTGLYTQGKYKYYFVKGIAATGWQSMKEGKRYFSTANGRMLTGLQKIGNASYYLDPKTGVIKTGSFTVGSTKYEADKNGKITKKNGTAVKGALAKGTANVNRAGMYRVDEEGNEVFINKNGKIYTRLDKGTTVLPHDAAINLLKGMSNPVEFIKSHMDMRPNKNITTHNTSDHVENHITFNLPNVTSYKEFMREAQKDPNFTKYIQEISLGRLNGNNSLKGNSIRFK